MNLKFEKETISRLDEQQMNDVNGGVATKLIYNLVKLGVGVTYGGHELSWWGCDDGGDGGDGGGATSLGTCGGDVNQTLYCTMDPAVC